MIKTNNYEAGTNNASFLLFKVDYDNKTELQSYIKKNYYAIISDEKNICPDCNQTMKIIGSRKRTVKDISGEQYVFSLRRMRCETCNIIHTEIPDCIIPHKQYSRNAINTAIKGQCDYYIMEDSTVFRWKKQNIPELQ